MIQVAVAMDLFELNSRKSHQALKHSLIDKVEGCFAVSPPFVFREKEPFKALDHQGCVIPLRFFKFSDD